MTTKQAAQLHDYNHPRTVQLLVEDFLDGLMIHERSVEVLELEPEWVVLVQVAPGRRLRNSPLIELQLRDYVLQQANILINRVYWRFRLEADDNLVLAQAMQDAGVKRSYNELDEVLLSVSNPGESVASNG